MKKILLAIIPLIFILTACGAQNQSQNTNNNSSAINHSATPSPEPLITDGMSIEEKVGQLFLVRCDDANIDSILDKNPAGLVMFGVDFENLTKNEVKDKINSYQEKSKYPLIMSVDEEGGTVVRVSSNPNLSDEKYASPQKYYANGGMDAVIENAKEKSELLKDLGLNMNLAPVADVSTDPNDFIYDRSFGQDASTTSNFITQVVNTMHEKEMASCLKHFPGYGNNVDTHTGISIDERSLDNFRTSDFLPFEAGIAANTDAILVSHNIMTAVDDTQPSSISPAVHDILRNELGYNGLIMTDDMAMEAMSQYGTPYIKAVLAGNNLIIVSDFETGYTEVLNAVKSGEISEETLNTAVEKTMEWKKANLYN